MSVRDAPHPLARSLGKLRQLNPWLSASFGVGGTTLSALAADAAALARHVRAVCDHYAVEEQRVGASLLLNELTWRVIGPLIGVYLSDRRVLRLEPAMLSIQVVAGSTQPLQLGAKDFYVLGDDPAAAHRDARPAAEVTELRGALRRSAVDALRPLVSSLRGPARRSELNQWRAVSDVLADACWSAGSALNCLDHATAEAERLLCGEQRLVGSANWLDPTPEASFAPRVRNVCCLVYLSPGESYCDSCPLVHGPRSGRRI